jgi:hypothetical protein
MNPTLIIRITVIVLIAVCWISAFVLFWKNPGDAVLSGFGCVVLIAFIAEHIYNYFVRRKK